MNLTPRLKQILKIMLEEESAISVKVLAERIGISRRTVQRELEFAENDVKPYGLTFCSKTGTGVWLEGSQEAKACLLAQLEEETRDEIGSKEDRRKRLILEILKDKSMKKLFYYSDLFGVSEATISSDLEAVEEWFTSQKLQIIRKPGSGIYIAGSEENYRRAIHTFVEENMDSKMLYEFYESGMVSGLPLEKTSLNQLLSQNTLKRVIACIAQMNDKHILNLTENSYIGLIMHISIAIERILNQEIIEQNAPWIQEMEQDEEYFVAVKMVEILEKEFDISIPKMEIAYICLHMKGAKHQRVEFGDKRMAEFERREMLALINEMMNAYDRELAYILRQDDEFIQGLLAHLQPTFLRILYDMKIKNPMLEEIKKAYPNVFSKCLAVAEVLESWLGKPVPEEEIGFLAIHFGAAEERVSGKKEEIRQVTVGIVCASGIGVSRLMSTKLDKTFRDRILIHTYGRNDITPYIISHTDFFVSSIPLTQLDACVVQVSPLLNEEDMECIRQKIRYYERIPREKEATPFTMELEQVNLLATQIKGIIRTMDLCKVDENICFEDLLVAIGEQVSPYHDMQEMVQEDIRKREKIGTQVFAEFGFALFHTRTRGVTRPVLLIYMTKNRQPFLDPYFKGITIVIVMLLPMDENIRVNSEIMGYISSTLMEEYDFLETIARGDKEEIRSVLSRYLKQYFNQHLNRSL